MEHAKEVAEAVLALFATCKFAHELVELAHHISKMKWAIRLFKF
jgi:hypothetical protein